jgi:hypothetical protein
MAKDRIENVASPDRTERVNHAKDGAIQDALLAVPPEVPPGLKVGDAKAALLPFLPHDRFAAGDKAGWWLKAVQRDVEAKGIIWRAPKRAVAARAHAAMMQMGRIDIAALEAAFNNR